MKSWLWTSVIVIIVGVISVISFQSSRIKELNERLETSEHNEHVLLNERDSLKKSSGVLLLTIEQLSEANDSILERMDEVRKELRIKDRELKELSWQLSEASKTDTLYLKDTIFRDPEFRLDSLVSDRWYSMKIQLEYPSTVIVTPSFTSERYVSMSLKKEYVGTPRKCWLARIFQKRHKVMSVDVVEKNPYIKVKEQRYVKIVE